MLYSQGLNALRGSQVINELYERALLTSFTNQLREHVLRTSFTNVLQEKKTVSMLNKLCPINNTVSCQHELVTPVPRDVEEEPQLPGPLGCRRGSWSVEGPRLV